MNYKIQEYIESNMGTKNEPQNGYRKWVPKMNPKIESSKYNHKTYKSRREFKNGYQNWVPKMNPKVDPTFVKIVFH